MKQEKHHQFEHTNRYKRIHGYLQIFLGLSLFLIVNITASKYYARIDITKTQKYSLSPETLAYLSKIDEPIEVIVTLASAQQEEEGKSVIEDIQRLLREYSYATRRNGEPLIEVSIVDLYQQRKKAEEILSRFQLEAESAIIVASRDRYKIINIPDLYVMEGGEAVSFQGEKQMTSAVIAVAEEDPATIYFTFGHGEKRVSSADPLMGLSAWKDQLLRSNYRLQELDLTEKGVIPEDADLVIVAGPQVALQEQEVEALRSYLNDRSGRVLFFVDPARQHGLDDLFYEWRVLADDRVIIDLDRKTESMSGDLIVRSFAEHPITQPLLDFQLYTLWGISRPIRVDIGAPKDPRLHLAELLASSKQSYGVLDYRSGKIIYNEKTDYQGPIPLAIVAERSASSDFGIALAGAQIGVFGNSDFISNNRWAAYGNNLLAMNTVHWMLEKDDLLQIPPQPLQTYQLTMSQDELWRLVLLSLSIPLAIAVWGIGVGIVRSRS